MTMTDKQIIREVVGRMADEAPPPLDVDELGDPLIRRQPDSTRRQSVKRRVAVATAAAAVLIAGIAGILLSGDQQPVGNPGERVSVPDSHPAAALVADGVSSYAEATSTLAASGEPFLCRENRPNNWALCLVYSERILAVVSFDNPEGTVARIRSEGLGETVNISVDGSQMIGFASNGGEVVLIVEQGGEFVGSAQGMGSD